VELPPGTYLLNISSSGTEGDFAQVTELVYLYPGLESKADWGDNDLFDLTAATVRSFTLTGTVQAANHINSFPYPAMTVTATTTGVLPADLNRTVPVTMFGDGGVWMVNVPQDFLGETITVSLNIPNGGTSYQHYPSSSTLTDTVTVGAPSAELNGPALKVEFFRATAFLYDDTAPSTARDIGGDYDLDAAFAWIENNAASSIATAYTIALSADVTNWETKTLNTTTVPTSLTPVSITLKSKDTNDEWTITKSVTRGPLFTVRPTAFNLYPWRKHNTQWYSE